MPYELLDHTGDIAIRVWASSLEELFEEAARAMFEQITDLTPVRPLQEEDILLPFQGPEEGLRDWLAELLYKFSGEGRIYRDFAVQFEADQLRGRVHGEPYDAGRHPLQTELKAVTYHQLQVVREKDGWRAQVVFDV